MCMCVCGLNKTIGLIIDALGGDMKSKIGQRKIIMISDDEVCFQM